MKLGAAKSQMAEELGVGELQTAATEPGLPHNSPGSKGTGKPRLGAYSGLASDMDGGTTGRPLGTYLRFASPGRIDDVLRCVEGFPVSYNRTLIAGSLDYCRLAILRCPKHDVIVLQAIEDYVNIAVCAIEPFIASVPPQWVRLDFTLLSDRFENLQVLCTERGLLPRLEDMTVEDVVRR